MGTGPNLETAESENCLMEVGQNENRPTSRISAHPCVGRKSAVPERQPQCP